MHQSLHVFHAQKTLRGESLLDQTQMNLRGKQSQDSTTIDSVQLLSVNASYLLCSGVPSLYSPLIPLLTSCHNN